MPQDHQQIISSVRHWLEAIVIGLNLCPFARRELVNNRIHFSVSDATTEAELLMDLQVALQEIAANQAIETTLLIHPYVLQDFAEYNQFLDDADALLQLLDLEGVYQIASFHPDYQFAGTLAHDVTNYTNRSPYPILHLLSENSVESAIAGHSDPEAIPLRNQELLEKLGMEKILALLSQP